MENKIDDTNKQDTTSDNDKNDIDTLDTPDWLSREWREKNDPPLPPPPKKIYNKEAFCSFGLYVKTINVSLRPTSSVRLSTPIIMILRTFVCSVVIVGGLSEEESELAKTNPTNTNNRIIIKAIRRL